MIIARTGAIPPGTLDGLRRLAAAEPGLRLVAGTDGNHGRAVAHYARLLGLDCDIYVPAAISPHAIDVLRHVLIPRALVITPNLPEAATLLDGAIARSEDEMRAQAVRLVEQGARAVLIKGGHAEGDESVDILQAPGSFTRLATARIATKSTHGTGCTLSSAIAAGLANGLDLIAAVREAKAYVSAAIAAADRLTVGSGHGPVHHFHVWW